MCCTVGVRVLFPKQLATVRPRECVCVAPIDPGIKAHLSTMGLFLLQQIRVQS